jgi:peptidoglycan hydrolase CwlO-like protein
MKIFIHCSIIVCLCLSEELIGLSRDDELQRINQQIERLENQLNSTQLHTRQEKVEGQKYMIADWDVYGQETKVIHQQELTENKLKEELNSLKGEKEQLLKHQVR